MYSLLMLLDEQALDRKLRSLGMKGSLFSGQTSFESRREKARVEVKKIPDVIFTRSGGRNVTLQEQFEKAYSCEL
jgi:hypothetical protein